MKFLDLSGRNRGLLVCGIWGTLRNTTCNTRTPEKLVWSMLGSHGVFEESQTTSYLSCFSVLLRLLLLPLVRCHPLQASDEVKCCAPAYTRGTENSIPPA